MRRSFAANVGLLLASFPAIFLTVSCVITLAWTAYLWLLSGQFPEPTGDSRELLGRGFMYACSVQLPIYLLWALLSRELPVRQRVNWALMILGFNAFTIPFFLFTKFTGTTSHYFSQNTAEV